MDAEEWQRTGLYDPTAPGADERKALLEYLTERGATIDQMVDAHRLGGLPAVAGDIVAGPVIPPVSVAEVAAGLGVTAERVERILLAVGLPVVADDVLPHDLPALLRTFEQGAAVMGEDAIFAFTRVLGAAAATIAEAAVALFYAEVGPGSAREGPDELARARVSERAMLAFTAVPESLAGVVMAQFFRTSRRAARVRGWTVPAAAGSSEIVALGFVDLVGSTAWAQELSLRDHSLALSRFESAAWSSAFLAGGRVVKMIGDEVFFTAPTVDTACRIGTEICRAVADDALLPPARGAVGHGPVLPREGDYFGPLVNVVSRLAKAAPPGLLVVTEDAAASLRPAGWALEALGPQVLRGLDHAVTAYAVHGDAPPPVAAF
ncbi:MAG TPA: adenylate/guanylate cyclase domain-containing protein [Acidimicrobiales bacterium]|nr:adenylate/guanylate cyclase domain-containing protein [Acidimicrobiales bacterium]